MPQIGSFAFPRVSWRNVEIFEILVAFSCSTLSVGTIFPTLLTYFSGSCLNLEKTVFRTKNKNAVHYIQRSKSECSLLTFIPHTGSVTIKLPLSIICCDSPKNASQDPRGQRIILTSSFRERILTIILSGTNWRLYASEYSH